MNLLVLSHLFPTPRAPHTGIFVREQVKALRTQGMNVTVICPLPWTPRALRWLRAAQPYVGIPRRATFDGVTVLYPRIPLPGGRGFALYPALYYLWLRRLLRREQLDRTAGLIHAHTIMPDGVAAALLGREFHLPVVCTLHGSDVNLYPQRSWLVRRLTQWGLRNVTALVAVSARLRQAAGELAPGIEERIDVVRNAADVAQFTPVPKQAARQRLGLPEERAIVLFVGNLVPVKAVDVLVRAVAGLPGPHPLLCIVGDGPKRAALEQQARILGVECRCAGRRPHEEIALWLAAADCLALPSVSEGFPTILPEAMMCRVPVVASDVGGVSEIVREGETGWLVPPRDAAALAGALRAVLALPQAAREAITARAAAAACQLTWEQNAREMAQVYARASRRPVAIEAGKEETACQRIAG